jgi:hypothetical protein
MRQAEQTLSPTRTKKEEGDANNVCKCAYLRTLPILRDGSRKRVRPIFEVAFAVSPQTIWELLVDGLPWKHRSNRTLGG